jgi:hypothetical protein
MCATNGAATEFEPSFLCVGIMARGTEFEPLSFVVSKSVCGSDGAGNRMGILADD